ncbi:iron-containing alcohol dehydrogenase [Roseobacter sp. HKCCA0434]|uniref:iron-containing alcohol dehydrogenase n=1 Tax=Roseobacter sp. HKCCA0434 TaxID=3079297 RepID=UPI002905A52D|nr:iron-containing alcohol dehydrogenase [Roseobacter sp. HKCCA0434]
MTPFQFTTTPTIRCAEGASGELADLFAGAAHVGVVTDATIRRLGLDVPAMDALRGAGLAVTVFDGVLPDPTEAMLSEACAALAGCDAVLGLGGGSPLDIAKMVAVRLASDQPLGEMYGVGNVTGGRLPLVLVPTTAGTGSEVTPISILTTATNEKMGVVSTVLLPDAAVLDPLLTLGLPRSETAATGIDAMVHAIEAFTSRLRKNPLSDMLAEQALRLLGANILTVCERPEDADARGAMLLGSCLAGQAFSNAPVAAVHALAYPLGGQFKVTHGLSNCLVLPEVVAFNMPEAEAHYAHLSGILFDGKPLPQGFRDLARQTGLPTTLREVGVSEGDLDALATDAMKQTRLLVNNPREMTYEAARAIYEAVL